VAAYVIVDGLHLPMHYDLNITVRAINRRGFKSDAKTALGRIEASVPKLTGVHNF